MAGRVRKSNKSFAKEPSSKITTRSRATRQVEVLADVINIKTRKRQPPKQPLTPTHPSPSPAGSRRRYKTEAVLSALVNDSDTEFSEGDITEEEETAATNDETNIISISTPAAIKNDLTSDRNKTQTSKDTICNNNKPVTTRTLRSKGPLVGNQLKGVESVNEESGNEGAESDKEPVELNNEGAELDNEGADEEMGSDHMEVGSEENIHGNEIDQEEEPVAMVTTGDKWACLRGMEIPVGREEQARAIVSIMGEPEEWAPPTLFIYGETAVGKTLLIKQILSLMEVPFGYANLRECYSSRVLYETILNTLSGVLPSASNRYSGYTRCDNLSQFVKDLRAIVVDNEWAGQSVYVVLDNYERAVNLEPTLVHSLVKLAELTDLNLCVMMLSQQGWEEFRISSHTIQIFFPQYKESEAMDILCTECPPGFSRGFYVEFLRQVWSMVHTLTRNINELKHMCRRLFPVYCQPLTTNEVTVTESRKLLNRFLPYCQKHLEHVYTRTLYSDEKGVESGQMTSLATPFINTPLHCSVPYFSKYLLIAAYLASYNSTDKDQQFFSQKRSRRRRTRRAAVNSKGDKIKRQLEGPRPFTLDRLLMIVRSITQDQVTVTTPLLSQIPTLVTLGLMARVSSSDALDIVKYKCLMSFESIREVSKSVEFEIVRYLSDYN